MAKPKKPKLCRFCEIAHESANITPRHLVHPVSGKWMLFDVCGEAVCPDCGARWRRTLNEVALITV